MPADFRQVVQQEVERLRAALEERLVGLAEKMVQEAVDDARRQLEATEERLSALERANGQAVLGRKLAEARLEEEVKRRAALEKRLETSSKEASRTKPAAAASAKARVEPPPRPEIAPRPPARESVSNVTADPPFAASRQAERVKLQTANDVLIDGVTSVLVDISTGGAQVLSPTTLRPNRVVRLMVRTSAGTYAVEGRIVWAHLESPSAAAGAQYRAGMQFTTNDRAAINALVSRQGEREAVPQS
jgi:PilZ domain